METKVSYVWCQAATPTSSLEGQFGSDSHMDLTESTVWTELHMHRIMLPPPLSCTLLETPCSVLTLHALLLLQRAD